MLVAYEFSDSLFVRLTDGFKLAVDFHMVVGVCVSSVTDGEIKSAPHLLTSVSSNQ